MIDCSIPCSQTVWNAVFDPIPSYRRVDPSATLCCTSQLAFFQMYFPYCYYFKCILHLDALIRLTQLCLFPAKLFECIFHRILMHYSWQCSRLMQLLYTYLNEVWYNFFFEINLWLLNTHISTHIISFRPTYQARIIFQLNFAPYLLPSKIIVYWVYLLLMFHARQIIEFVRNDDLLCL